MSAVGATIKIHNDVPIKEIREDRFGRSSLVDLLAKSIQEKCRSEHDSICIGIYGKWGQGKTSFVNMLINRLKTAYKSYNADIVVFNPWLVSSGEVLIQEFFKNIISTSSETTFKNAMIEYGGLIASAAREMGTILSPLLGSMLGTSITAVQKYLLSKEKSLIEHKEFISENLSYSGEHLLVFIDDIDRLDSDEMHAVLRLVRQVADFKNTIYVLSLDEERVAKSIGKYYGEGCEQDGRRYLEKIVQIPIVLPQVQRNVIKSSLKQSLMEVFNYCGLDGVLEVDEILDKIHSLFETEREILRYKNQLQFFFPAIHTEVNHCDYCILEAIKTLNQEAYNLIRDNRTYMLKHLLSAYKVKNGDVDISKNVEKEYDILIDKVVDLFSRSKQEAVRKIMTSYLPDVSNNSSQSVRTKRLCSEIYFDRYFLQSVPNHFISDRDVDSVNSNDVESIKGWITSKEGFYSDTEIARALFNMVDRSTIGQYIQSNVCIALSTSPPASRNEFAAIAEEMTKVLLITLSDIDFAKTTEIIFSTANLDYCMVILGTLTTKDIERISHSAYDLLKRRSNEVSLINIFSYPKSIQEPFFRIWKKFDKSDFMTSIQNMFEHPDFDANKFLNDFLPSDDDNGLVKEVDNIVRIFGSRLCYVLDKIHDKKGKLKVLARNFPIILEQFRNSSEGDELYC